MVNGKAVVTARAKARQAKAALDVERAKQDRLVLDAATEFYEAVDALTVAREAIAAAEQQQTKSVTRLAELDQTDEQVATLRCSGEGGPRPAPTGLYRCVDRCPGSRLVGQDCCGGVTGAAAPVRGRGFDGTD